MSRTDVNQTFIPKTTNEASSSANRFRLNKSRLRLVCAAVFAIVGSVQHVMAQDASLAGDWTHSRDAAEQEKRYEAIDQATDSMNSLLRGRARQLLREKTKPLASIGLSNGGDRVTMYGPNRRFTFTTDGSPNRVQTESGAATLRAKWQDGKLVLTSQTKKGIQKTTYQLSEDGMRLILETSVSGGMLKNPVRFRTTYQRASSK